MHQQTCDTFHNPSREEKWEAFLIGACPPQSRPASPPNRVICDSAGVSLAFNVMPNRPVRETLECREYRVWPNYVEADFDRRYMSSMEASPSHLIVMTAQTHGQKLAYLAIAESFGRPYQPDDKEYFKMWWTASYCNVPTMIRIERNLQQSLWITELLKIGPRSYMVEAYSRVCESMEIWARGPLFLI